MNLAFFEDLFSDDSEPDFTGLYDKSGRELRLFLRNCPCSNSGIESHDSHTVTPVTPT